MAAEESNINRENALETQGRKTILDRKQNVLERPILSNYLENTDLLDFVFGLTFASVFSPA